MTRFALLILIYWLLAIPTTLKPADLTFYSQRYAEAEISFALDEAISLSVGTTTPEEPVPGEPLSIPFMATGLTGANRLHAATIHVTYNSSVLLYQDFHSAYISNADRNVVNGTFSLAWSSISGVEVDGSTLFTLHFIYQGGGTEVDFRNDSELADTEGSPLAVDFIGATVGSFPEEFTITAEAIPAGGGTVSGTGTFAEGTAVTLTALPSANYLFTGWYEHGSLLETGLQMDVVVDSDRHFEARFSLRTYTLTYLAGTGGSISGENPQTVAHGSNGAPVQAVPLPGRAFSRWSDGRTDNPRTDMAVTANLTVTADFTLLFYDVTAEVVPAGAGTVNGTGNYAINTLVTLTASPAAGYDFTGWYEHGILLDPGLQMDVVVDSDRHFEARFSLRTYTLTYLAGPEGSISGENPQTVAHGGNGTPVQAVPLPGYAFSGWSDGRTDNPRTDMAVTADVTVTAEFIILYYDVTAEVVPAGAGTVNGTGNYAINTIVTLTASPAVEYDFTGWYEHGILLGPALQLDVVVDSDRHFEARFSLRTYTLTYLAGPGGSIAGENPQTVAHGSDGTPVEAVAAAGYYFVAWSDGRSDNPRTDRDVTGNLEVTAIFAELGSYLVMVTSNPAGAGILSGGGRYTEGDQAIVRAEAAFGYVFINWTNGGVSVSSSPEYSFTVTSNITLVANFILQQFNITAVPLPQTGGTVTGAGTYPYNTFIDLVAIPQEGYYFTRWTEDNATMSLEPEMRVLVNGHRHFEARFEQFRYTLTYEAGEGGRIEGAHKQEVAHGGQGDPVTAVAGVGYVFFQWDDGSTDNPRVDRNVTTDMVLKSIFLPIEYTVEVITTPEGAGNAGILTEAPYRHGTLVAVKAEANEGYLFAHWMENGNIVSEDAEFQFKIYSNRKLEARFELVTYKITALPNPPDAGTISGTGIYTFGSSIAITAVAAVGYAFAGWYENGEIAGVDHELELTVDTDRHFVAEFVLKTFTVRFLITDGSGTPLDSATVELEEATAGKGHYTFEDLLPGSYRYRVVMQGYFPVEGNFEIGNDDLEIKVSMRVDDTRSHAASGFDIQIYPNPVAGQLNILSKEPVKHVTVFDMSGDEVAAIDPTQGSRHFTVDLGHLKKGVYILHIFRTGYDPFTRLIMVH